jgi:phage tail sheath protein FI
MADTFLHGVQVLEVSDGRRPIRTVRSSVIGLIGTASDSEPDVKATLNTGVVSANNAITFTSKLPGVSGNQLKVALIDPAANNAAIAVSVSGYTVTVSLATSAGGTITSTPTTIKTAIENDAEANALVSVANTTGSSGASAVTAVAETAFSGGVDEPFPVNKPVLVAANRTTAAKLGDAGTLSNALDGIFDQTGAVVVVVRVDEGATDADTIDNIIGGVNVDGHYEGVHAFLGAESSLGVVPRILIAPGFTGDAANGVVSELIGIAPRLRAVIVADGPDTTDEDAVAYAGSFGSDRLYVVDPGVRVIRNGVEVIEPASARVAGLIAKSDNDRGFWWSPSNQEIAGIVGTTRAVDFALGDASTRANLLNEANITTIIRQNGFRLWGNRTTSEDAKFAFLSVRRTADLINDSILRAHLWAVDRNITKTYLEDVAGAVNDYLKTLQAEGAILGGSCWPTPDLNTPANISAGKVYFSFDFTPPYPAEDVTFISILTNDYIEDLVSTSN